jgi:hypothetical protein
MLLKGLCRKLAIQVNLCSKHACCLHVGVLNAKRYDNIIQAILKPSTKIFPALGWSEIAVKSSGRDGAVGGAAAGLLMLYQQNVRKNITFLCCGTEKNISKTFLLA